MKHIERADKPAFLSQALVLTDDREQRSELSAALRDHGLEVAFAGSLGEGLDMEPGASVGLMFLDLDSASAQSFEFLRRYPAADSRRVVLLTSAESASDLAPAMESGALTYLRKPVVGAEVGVLLDQIRRNRLVPPRRDDERDYGLYGSSPQIQAVRKILAQAARSGAHVAISGEPGVGKRLTGHLIHEQGRERNAAFVQLSCAGINADVVEDLLFGTRLRGVESGGYLARCAGGTLLIDDIDTIHPRVQERLCEYLADGAPAPGGSPTLRVIAVSAASLARSVDDGAFDSDLYGLLDHVRIEIPPLRERRADIPILADHFSRAFSRARSASRGGIEPAALSELMRYDWPGNVRELKDVLGLAVGNATGGVLGLSDLPALPEAAGSTGPGPRIPGSSIHEIERDAILRTLQATGGSTSRAARILQMSVRKIQYKLKEYRTENASITPVESLTPVVGKKPPSAAGRVMMARSPAPPRES